MFKSFLVFLQSLEQDVNTHYLSLSHEAQRDPVQAEKGFHYDILSLQVSFVAIKFLLYSGGSNSEHSNSESI